MIKLTLLIIVAVLWYTRMVENRYQEEFAELREAMKRGRLLTNALKEFPELRAKAFDVGD